MESGKAKRREEWDTYERRRKIIYAYLNQGMSLEQTRTIITADVPKGW
jgi:hypothetical protein